MKISVIIPTYNMAHFIGDAIDSVLAQTLQDIEIIVMDDGSTDGTTARVVPYPAEKVRYRFQENSGFPGAVRNAAIKSAKGEYIAFLDADDRMRPERLAKQLEFLEAHKDVAAVFCDYQNFSADERHHVRHFQRCPLLASMLGSKDSLVLSRQAATELLAKENIGLPSSMMVRRQVPIRIAANAAQAMMDLPQFPTDLKVGEDFHFTYTIARFSQVGILNFVGCDRRLHGANLSAESIASLRSKLESRRRLIATEYHRPARQHLKHFVSRVRVMLARELGNQRQFVPSLWQCVITARHSLVTSARLTMRLLAIAVGARKAIPGS